MIENWQYKNSLINNHLWNQKIKKQILNSVINSLKVRSYLARTKTPKLPRRTLYFLILPLGVTSPRGGSP